MCTLWSEKGLYPKEINIGTGKNIMDKDIWYWVI